jgi:hypothetical protein
MSRKPKNPISSRRTEINCRKNVTKKTLAIKQSSMSPRRRGSLRRRGFPCRYEGTVCSVPIWKKVSESQLQPDQPGLQRARNNRHFSTISVRHTAIWLLHK